MAERGREHDPVAWYGGGQSWSEEDEAAYQAQLERARIQRTPYPSKRTVAGFGDPAPLGARGLVAGRFLPMHRGHQYLLDFATASVEHLVILVATRPDDPLPYHLRARWLAELYPDAQLAELTMAIDGDTRELAARIRTIAGEPTHFFASEPSYVAIANELRATFVPVDPTRIVIPTSGTAIRANVMENFHFIVPPARPWFARRVAVVGAESTGKSTLCAQLRDAFEAVVVPEYARTLGAMPSSAVQLVARSQIASEDALALQVPGGNGGGLLVCDTDLRAVKLWSDRLYEGDLPPWIEAAIAVRPYDLYLLCSPDIPFVGYPERDHPVDRRTFHDLLLASLAGQPVVLVEGDRAERFQIASDAIVSLFSPTTLLSARGTTMI